MKLRKNVLIVLAIGSFIGFSSCKNTNSYTMPKAEAELIDLNKSVNSSFVMVVDFEKGNSFNHPLMALWAEDVKGNYLETFYVAQSIGKGVYQKTSNDDKGKWLPGPNRRPATLPYWAHKRGVKESDGLYLPTPQTAMTDAVTGATPKQDFRIIAKPTLASFPRVFNLLFEINQSWDWNEYWSNTKYTDDREYRTSSQPSLVYSASINLDSGVVEYHLNPIGHGHYAGKDGVLYTDLSTLTTALEIAKKISVTIK